MSTTTGTYDVAIIGGGLAGLSLSISLAQKGRQVILLEKEAYPLNRVCGEYISMESWPFLERLGIPLSDMRLPRINQLRVSAPDGFSITQPLDLGGFGISRFTLDALLAKRAIAAGVTLREDCKVTDAAFAGNEFRVEAGSFSCRAAVAIGSFGKRSNIDVGMKRPFVMHKPGKFNNYIGIKYHIRMDLPSGQIGLHNFDGGYCGVSEVDGDRHCLCYLTTASNLKKSGNSIPQMEEQILYQNPHLRDIFTMASFESKRPESIARISFQQKDPVEQGLLMTGDAAGMISPLCGNGMSMAFRSGQMAQDALLPFLEGRTSRQEMEERYRTAWKRQFSAQMRTGRLIQSLFGRPKPTKLFLKLLSPFPIFTRQIIRRTHGNAF